MSTTEQREQNNASESFDLKHVRTLEDGIGFVPLPFYGPDVFKSGMVIVSVDGAMPTTYGVHLLTEDGPRLQPNPGPEYRGEEEATGRFLDRDAAIEHARRVRDRRS